LHLHIISSKQILHSDNAVCGWFKHSHGKSMMPDGLHFEKSKNRQFSATDQRIATKYGKEV